MCNRKHQRDDQVADVDTNWVFKTRSLCELDKHDQLHYNLNDALEGQLSDRTHVSNSAQFLLGQ